jgi:rhodanese-related sulfurtransferase
MKRNRTALSLIAVILLCSPLAVSNTNTYSPNNQPSDVQYVSAEELKAKLTKSQPVTIIDVRATESYADSNRKIKGAIHVKLRRLKYRLGFEPLNKISHDSEVVTYCACPNDELSIKAVQMLQESGFKRARVLKGGWNAWLKLNGPVESVAKGM